MSDRKSHGVFHDPRPGRQKKKDPDREKFIQSFNDAQEREAGPSDFGYEPPSPDTFVVWFTAFLVFGVFLRLLGLVTLETKPGERISPRLVLQTRIRALKVAAESMKMVLNHRDPHQAVIHLVTSGGRQSYLFAPVQHMVQSFTGSDEDSESYLSVQSVVEALSYASTLPPFVPEQMEEPDLPPTVKKEDASTHDVFDDLDKPLRLLFLECDGKNLGSSLESKSLAKDIVDTMVAVSDAANEMCSCSCSKSSLAKAKMEREAVLRPPDTSPLEKSSSTRHSNSQLSTLTAREAILYAFSDVQRQYRSVMSEERDCPQCRRPFLVTPIFKRKYKWKKKHSDLDLGWYKTMSRAAKSVLGSHARIAFHPNLVKPPDTGALFRENLEVEEPFWFHDRSWSIQPSPRIQPLN